MLWVRASRWGVVRATREVLRQRPEVCSLERPCSAAPAQLVGSTGAPALPFIAEVAHATASSGARAIPAAAAA
eukprot:14095793-Alexandrium_andersonii.AAC.1